MLIFLHLQPFATGVKYPGLGVYYPVFTLVPFAAYLFFVWKSVSYTIQLGLV